MTVEIDTALRQRVFESMSTNLPTVLNHPIPALADGTALMNDLGLRSATTLELLLLLEDDLEIQIDLEEIDQFDVTTAGELADYVAGHATAF